MIKTIHTDRVHKTKQFVFITNRIAINRTSAYSQSIGTRKKLRNSTWLFDTQSRRAYEDERVYT